MTTPPDRDRQRLERENKRLRHELEEAVRALPHLRQMVQFSGDLLILAAAGGRILEANARLAEVLGVEPHALYGQVLQRWLSHPGQIRLLEERLAAGAAPAPLRMEIELTPGQGEPRTMELEAPPLHQPSDPADITQPRWTIALRDIGLRRQLESSEAARQVQAALIDSLRSSEARYQELVEQLSDGLGQIDAGGTLLFANPAMRAALGADHGTIAGHLVDGAAGEELPAVLVHGQRRPDLRRQVGAGQDVALGAHHHRLDGVAQLAHVARPVVALELGERLGRDAGEGVRGPELAEHAAHERRDVVEARPERGQIDAHLGHAEEEIGRAHV